MHQFQSFTNSVRKTRVSPTAKSAIQRKVKRVGFHSLLFAACAAVSMTSISGCQATPEEKEAYKAQEQADDKQRQLDYDKYLQDQHRSELEEQGRKTLLNEGHTPEDTERIIDKAKNGKVDDADFK